VVGRTLELLDALSKRIPVKHLAGHFHDTYGQALANILAALQVQFEIFSELISGWSECI